MSRPDETKPQDMQGRQAARCAPAAAQGRTMASGSGAAHGLAAVRAQFRIWRNTLGALHFNSHSGGNVHGGGRTRQRAAGRACVGDRDANIVAAGVVAARVWLHSCRDAQLAVPPAAVRQPVAERVYHRHLRRGQAWARAVCGRSFVPHLTGAGQRNARSVSRPCGSRQQEHVANALEVTLCTYPTLPTLPYQHDLPGTGARLDVAVRAARPAHHVHLRRGYLRARARTCCSSPYGSLNFFLMKESAAEA